MTSDNIAKKNKSSGLLDSEEQIQIIKETVCKDLSPGELKLFLYTCKQTGLNPLMGQIYPIKRWDKNSGKEVLAIQIGVDGYRVMAERTGKYSPGKASEFSYTKEGKLFSVKAFLKKQTQDGHWHEVCGTAFFTEQCQTNKEGSPLALWKTKPHLMLEKCAEAMILRKAFPNDLALTEEEEVHFETETNEPISTEQLKHLLEEIKDDSEILKSLMAWGDVKTLKELPKSKFETALKTVKFKRTAKT